MTRRKVSWSRVILAVLLTLSLAMNYIAIRSALYDDHRLKLHRAGIQEYCLD